MGVLCWVPSHKIVLNIYDEKLLLFLLISSSNPIFLQQGGSPLTPFPIPLCLQKSTVSSGTLAVLLAFLTNVILLFCVFLLTICVYHIVFIPICFSLTFMLNSGWARDYCFVLYLYSAWSSGKVSAL